MESALFLGWQQVLSFISSQGALLTLLLGLVVLLMLVLLLIEHRANKKYREQHLKLLEGVHTANVEEFIINQNAEMGRLQAEVARLAKEVVILEKIQQLAIQRVGFVRYNPFQDLGGDQSFSLALLDGRESGFVLTCIFGREESRLFAKAIKDGESRYRLTDEELLAIDRAKKDQSIKGLLEKGGGEMLP
ncbi:MAG: DUF4446 family protein [Bacillota bacterium]